MQRDYSMKELKRVEELNVIIDEIQSTIDTEGFDAFISDKKPDFKKRLYSRIYWVVFQNFLRKYRISQRKMCEDLKMQKSTIAQMIHRNTLPSSKFEEKFIGYLSNISSIDTYAWDLAGIRRENVISTFKQLDTKTTYEVLYRFEESENNETSVVKKSIVRALRDMTEMELKQVSEYIEWLKSRR